MSLNVVVGQATRGVESKEGNGSDGQEQASMDDPNVEGVTVTKELCDAYQEVSIELIHLGRIVFQPMEVFVNISVMVELNTAFDATADRCGLVVIEVDSVPLL